LLPKKSASWSKERLEAVLLHELAHVRRLDYVSQLISVAVSALYWFNPLVWLCARAMRAEAEAAADDTVIRSGVKPSDYAQELLRIAADLGSLQKPFAPIGVPVMRHSKIESRVRAILDPSARRRRGMTLVEALATFALSSAIAIPLGAFHAGVAVPSEPDPTLIAPQSVAASESRPVAFLSTPLSTEASLVGGIAQSQSQKSKDEAKLKRLKQTSRSQSIDSKDHFATINAERRQLEAEVRALRAQQASMKAELIRAKAQLETSRQRLLAERKQLEESFRSRADRSAQEMSSAQKREIEALRDAQERLLKAQESAGKEQKAEMKRQLVEMDARRESMAHDMSAAKKQIEAARQQLEQARARAIEQMSKDRQSSRDSRQVYSADVQKKMVEAARAKLENAKTHFSRLRALYDQGYVGAQDVDEAEAAIKEAEARLAMETAKLADSKQK
jgi:hypothetical protein